MPSDAICTVLIVTMTNDDNENILVIYHIYASIVTMTNDENDECHRDYDQDDDNDNILVICHTSHVIFTL